MKHIKLFMVCLLVSCGTLLDTAAASETQVPVNDRAAWMDEAKFGLFIHWGIYSKHARGEWVMNREKIPVAEYSKLAESFNPVKFNADQWVAVAKNAGMKYITITSKHHDGFCIFDTAVDNYNIVDDTPFRRDVLKELKEACEKAGIKLGFYYSHAQDWYHPGGSGRKWDPAQKGDFRTYLDTVSFPQIKELLTQYDPTHLWFDTPHAMNAEIGRELVGVVRFIKPDTLINSRLIYHGNQVVGLSQEQLDELVDVGVDFLSYRDRTIPEQSPWEYWETCMTLNGSWGYNAKDSRWKSPAIVIKQLVEVVSKGGTFLLNVGPTAEGEIPQEAVECLAQVGDWLKVNGEAVYGATPTLLKGAGDFAKVDEAARAALEKEALMTGAGKAKKGHKSIDYAWLVTGRQGKLYIHLFKWPNESLVLSGPIGQVTGAYFLADPAKKPLNFTQTENELIVRLSAKALRANAMVLCLTLKDEH